MPGKLIEINPEVSLHADEIRALQGVAGNSPLIVHTRQYGVLEVLPLEGETLEMARHRIHQATNANPHLDRMVAVDDDAYLNPADVVGVTVRRDGVWIDLRSGNGSYQIASDTPRTLAAEIAARINAEMRERQSI